MAPKLLKKSLLALTLCLCSITAIRAQQATYFPYFTSDSIRSQTLANSHRESLKNAFVLPAGINKKYKRDFQSLTESLTDNIYYTIRDGALLDSEIEPYLQEIFDQILKSNPQLPPARLVLVRNPIENAYALGDGTVLFNIGLLSKLETKGQVAFVLCHELAHIYFGHMQKGVEEYFDTFYNEEFQNQYKKIVKQEYNMYAKLNSLVENASLNNLYHKRTHEQQADSLGYVLLSKSNFDTGQAIAALELLDNIDQPFSAEEIDFSKYFGCPDTYSLFDVKPARATSIFQVEKKETTTFALTDTLKTHPDCQKRILYLKGLQQPVSAETVVQEQQQFNHIKAISRIEVIQSWYDVRRFDRALFETLLLLEKTPENHYLRSMVLLCLFELKEHMQAHKYYNVVARVSDFYPPNYNQLLIRLHNLNLSDFPELGKCFDLLNPADTIDDEYGLATLYAVSRITNDHDTAEQLKRKYGERYAAGRFSKSLFK